MCSQQHLSGGEVKLKAKKNMEKKKQKRMNCRIAFTVLDPVLDQIFSTFTLFLRK